VTAREQYAPGPANGAQVRKDGEKWTLVLVRELRHSPETVWQAITDPAQLREWAPFDANQSLATTGRSVTLTTVGAPTPMISETTVTRADAPKVLEYMWGGFDMRWELEPLGGGTRIIAGFENHGGRTYLGEGEQPLGRVLKGHGNNGKDGFEGVRKGNVIGTYLHGPLLPKNVWLADRLIELALGIELEPLPGDSLEDAAHLSARRAAGVA